MKPETTDKITSITQNILTPDVKNFRKGAKALRRTIKPAFTTAKVKPEVGDERWIPPVVIGGANVRITEIKKTWIKYEYLDGSAFGRIRKASWLERTQPKKAVKRA